MLLTFTCDPRRDLIDGDQHPDYLPFGKFTQPVHTMDQIRRGGDNTGSLNPERDGAENYQIDGERTYTG